MGSHSTEMVCSLVYLGEIEVFCEGMCGMGLVALSSENARY